MPRLSRTLPVLLMLLQPASAQQTPPAGSIEGTVLSSHSGMPLSRAQLTLTRVDTGNSEPEGKLSAGNTVASSTRVFTDAEGKFVFRGVPPGPHRLLAERNGYVPQAYGQRSAEGEGLALNVASETIRGITVRMVQGAVVSGRVRDALGEPVAGLHVALLRSVYDNEGKRILTVAREAYSDDRGEYRVYWIAPGRYYVRVGRSPRSGDDLLKIVADRMVQTVYYPGSSSPEQAIAVDLQPGAEVSTIDIVLPEPSGHRLRGRVVDGTTGKPPKSVDIGLFPRQRGAVLSDEDNQKGADYNAETGAFEIQNVIPGDYLLNAGIWGQFDEPVSADALGNVRTGKDLFEAVFAAGPAAQVLLSMPASDLDGVVLTLGRGVSIPVRLTIETSDNTPVRGIEEMRVELASPGPGWSMRLSSRFSAQGAAQVKDVLPGEYGVYVHNEPISALYVKQIRYGRTDALREFIQVTADGTDTLNIVVSTKGGQIEGTLLDALTQAPVTESVVVLIPDQRDRKDLYRQTTTDHHGRFNFRAIAPGDYRVLSWDGLEPNAYYDPQILAQHVLQGRPVQVQESELRTIDLRTTTPKP